MKGKQMEQTIVSIAGAIMNPEFRARKNYSRPPFVFWGPKGSGKTYNVNKAANKLHIPDINIRLGQELAEDMSYPEITEQNGEKFLSKIIAEMFPRYKRDEDGKLINRRKIVDGQIVTIEGEYQINFTKIKTYIENWNELEAYYNSLGLSVDDAPGAIIFLDEVNRIEDKQMFQMIFQLFDSGKFKGYVTPEEISFFAAANPNEGYIVADWFADPAFTNRCIHLKTIYDFDTWYEYASEPDSGYDALTLEFYRINPKALFDERENNFELPKYSSSFRNPSFLSLYVNGIEYANSDIREEILAAVIGTTYIANFHLVEDDLAEKAPTAEEILTQYDEYEIGSHPLFEKIVGKTVDGQDIIAYEINTLKDAIDYQFDKNELRTKILEAKELGKTDLINDVTQNMIDYLHNNIESKTFQEKLDSYMLRFIRFMFDLPRGKFATTFQQLVSDNKKETSQILADALTTGKNGTYLVQLIKYDNERILKKAI